MSKNPVQTKWLAALVEAAENAVLGYEQYLLDELNYLELAKLMTKLKKLLPKDEE